MAFTSVPKGTRDGVHGKASGVEVRDVFGAFVGYEVRLNGVAVGEGGWFSEEGELGAALLAALNLATTGTAEGPEEPASVPGSRRSP